MKILAVIPARGGSKRIPKKNIKKLGNKPLIAWTIKAARKAKMITDIIVSTDSEDIEEVSRKFGAETIKRPKGLAMDWAKTIDVVLHAIRGMEYEVIVCLQPTSPFRTAEDIDNAVNLFINDGCDSVISVCRVWKEQSWFMKMENKYLVPILGNKYFDEKPKMPEVFVPNGAIYVSSPQSLYKYHSFYGKRILPYIMPADRSLDIDDKLDFVIAQQRIK